MWFVLERSVHGLLRLGSLLILFFVVAADVLFNIVFDHVDSDPDDEREPEDVDDLQGGQKSEGDALTKPAFVLLGVPVELVRSHVPEIGEHGGEDDKVDIMA